MQPPLVVTVTRGGVVESTHRVHAVAVADRRVVEEAGDRSLVTFMRSAAKPIQALPLARAYGDLDDRSLAIASASHLASPDQLAAVRGLLDRADASEDDLECGPAGDPPRKLNHNCSGKHAGMLAVCRARGWPFAGYRLAEHPLQQALLVEVAGAAEFPSDGIATAIDGCGVVTFALPLERMATAFARFGELDEGPRVAAAMRANPELIRGPGAPDTELMRAVSGWIAKGGAEGLMCARSADGIGIALKVEDGNSRAVGPALAAFLARLGYKAPLARLPVENSRGELVGEVSA